MRSLKIYALLLVLLMGLTVSAQTSKSSKSKSTKSKSHKKAKSTADKSAVAVADSVIVAPPSPPAPPPPPPPTMMKYFVDSYPEFSILVKGINATQLNETFESGNPITVFAPVNRTFDNLPAGTIRDILQPQMRDSLKGVLTYMVIAGNWSLEQLQQKIKEGGGSFSVPTIGGMGKLSFVLDGSAVRVKDNRGTQMQLSAPVITKSGMVYVVDRLLLP
jgi:uncharacterized surface protein with fasciclin (FAS1) repeats